MGGFSLCVEASARDIDALLALHKVHPQVRSDAQRILRSLIRKSYEAMDVAQSTDVADAPDQVCRAIAQEIVNRVVDISIPQVQLDQREQECMGLQQRELDLQEALDGAHDRCIAVEHLLDDLKRAHDYMLHSYFREVLILRTRIHDMRRMPQRRASLSFSNIIPVATGQLPEAITTMDSQLKQFCVETSESVTINREKSITDVKGIAATAADGRGTQSPHRSTHTGSHHATGDVAASSPLAASSSIGSNGMAEHRMLSATTAPGPTLDRLSGSTLDFSASTREGGDGQRLSSLDPRGEIDSRRGSQGLLRRRLPMGSKMMLTTSPNAELFLAPPEPWSIDAIFDYEEYVRLLNGNSVAPFDKRYNALKSEPVGKGDITERYRRRVNLMRVNRPRPNLFLESVGLSAEADELATQLELEKAKTEGFRWLLHLALEPIKDGYLEELAEIRNAVVEMQSEYARQLAEVQESLTTLQSRTDALLDFLRVYVNEMMHTLHVLSLDAAATDPSEFLAHEQLPLLDATHTVKTFFHVSPGEVAAAAKSVKFTPGQDRSKSDSHIVRQLWRVKPVEVLHQNPDTTILNRLTSAVAQGNVEGGIRHLSSATLGAVAVVRPVLSTGGPEADKEWNARHYRGDLGLPFWEFHPIIRHAQNAFETVQRMAAYIRSRHAQVLSGDIPEGSEGVGYHAHFDLNGTDANGGVGASPNSTPMAGSQEYAAGVLRKKPAPRVLRDGWKSSVVDGFDGLTAGDLVEELTQLRMKRVCEQARLRRWQENLTAAKLAVRHRGDGHPEYDSLRRVVAAKRRIISKQLVDEMSRRIANIEGSLDAHLEGFRDYSADFSGCDDPSKIYPVRRRTTSELWRSPYLNSVSGSHIASSPTALSSNADAMAASEWSDVAQAIVGGGANAYVLFGDKVISAAALTNSGTGPAANGAKGGRSAYAAVMDYCRGVQLGRPMGASNGPVFLLQDDAKGGFYVADSDGHNLSDDTVSAQGNSNESGAAVATSGGGDGRRLALPMTRIIFPAPRDVLAVQSTFDPEEPLAAPQPFSSYLRPIYFVPMAVPLSDEETVREAWQAVHRHGHTRDAPIFYQTANALPLSTTQSRLLPSSCELGNGWPTTSGVVYDTATVQHALSGNPYLHHPPRIFHPASDGNNMMTVKSLATQYREDATSSLPPPVRRPGEETRSGDRDSISTTAAAAGNGSRPGGLRSAAAAEKDQPNNSIDIPSISLKSAVQVSIADGDAGSPVNSMASGRSEAQPVVLLEQPLQSSPGSALRRVRETNATRKELEMSVAKEQRIARQEAWRRREESRAPTEQEKFLRLPHLAPPSARSGEISLKPLPGSSAKLQKQMRPGKYCGMPQRREKDLPSTIDWKLDDT